MRAKRNRVKQIMSEIHREARSGKLDLGGHGGFVAEVKRRIRAAGLSIEDLPDLTKRRRRVSRDEGTDAAGDGGEA